MDSAVAIFLVIILGFIAVTIMMQLLGRNLKNN